MRERKQAGHMPCLYLFFILYSFDPICREWLLHRTSFPLLSLWIRNLQRSAQSYGKYPRDRFPAKPLFTQPVVQNTAPESISVRLKVLKVLVSLFGISVHTALAVTLVGTVPVMYIRVPNVCIL